MSIEVDGESRDEVVSNRFVASGPHERFGSPVYYGGAVYAFVQTSQPLRLLKFQVSTTGTVDRLDPVEMPMPRTRGSGLAKLVASCVYDGRIFVFYDWDRTDWKFSIRYKTTSNPDETELDPWDGYDDAHPDDPEAGFDTGLLADYEAWWPQDAIDCLHATVLDDKIFLFFMRDGTIHFATYDGAKWSDAQAVTGRHGDGRSQPHFAITTVNRGEEQCIALCSQERADRDKAVISFIDGGGAVSSIIKSWQYFDHLRQK